MTAAVLPKLTVSPKRAGRALALGLAVGLAGCADPFAYPPERAFTRPPLPYDQQPAYAPPPVVFQRPDLPLDQSPAFDQPLVKPSDQDPALPIDPIPDDTNATSVEPAPPDPSLATPTEAQPVNPVPVPSAPAPEKGGVPLMGFRPMHGQ